MQIYRKTPKGKWGGDVVKVGEDAETAEAYVGRDGRTIRATLMSPRFKVELTRSEIIALARFAGIDADELEGHPDFDEPAADLPGEPETAPSISLPSSAFNGKD